jgi:hypothetical protein
MTIQDKVQEKGMMRKEDGTLENAALGMDPTTQPLPDQVRGVIFLIEQLAHAGPFLLP